MTAQPELIVYSRQGCHLCEVLVEELLPLARGRASVTVVDVDTRDELREAYGLRVPVVELNGECLCQYTLDAARVRDALAPGPR